MQWSIYPRAECPRVLIHLIFNVKDTFGKYLEEAIGKDRSLVAFSAFDRPAPASVRMNPYKCAEPPAGRPVAWCGYGIILDERPVFTLDPLFHAGAYYVQDSSSMFVGHAFRSILGNLAAVSGRPVRVLDLCAAPGGKTTDMAASLREAFGGNFLLVANEVMKSRAGVLAGNVAVWGDPNVAVTSDDPRAFAALPGFFDVILADVPCSGEGMFRKDANAVEQWSEDNVALCQARQRRIIADVWPALAPGGFLIYSTCTFNRYENDCNAEWIASEQGAECIFADAVPSDFPGLIKTEYGCSLVPGFVEGEGQYCSVLKKVALSAWPDGRRSGAGRGWNAQAKTEIPREARGLVDEDCDFRLRGNTVIAVPQTVSADVAMLGESLHLLASGCAVGTLKGKLLVPDADLALSLIFQRDAFPAVSVGRSEALAYLHRDPVVFPQAEKGYLTIEYEHLPIGFVKNLGNRCNSLHPQSRRIRMDINK